jgi:hypothetical protein
MREGRGESATRKGWSVAGAGWGGVRDVSACTGDATAVVGESSEGERGQHRFLSCFALVSVVPPRLHSRSDSLHLPCGPSPPRHLPQRPPSPSTRPPPLRHNLSTASSHDTPLPASPLQTAKPPIPGSTRATRWERSRASRSFPRRGVDSTEEMSFAGRRIRLKSAASVWGSREAVYASLWGMGTTRDERSPRSCPFLARFPQHLARFGVLS